MSADLMVFDKSKAPAEPMEFLKWFYEKTTWTSDRDYYDIKGASPELVNFFMEIIREYPAMNGPFAPSDEEMEKIEDDPELESRLTEYNIDDDLIYMGFAWSVSDKACELVEELAYKHGLGFFDMFDVHLDRNTVIKIPQISKEKLNQEENKQGTKRKGLFGWLFGK